MPPTIDVDRNLLFAVIALQDDLIDQTQFADVCAGWAVRIERSLSDLLIERGWIKKQDKEDVERKLERKLKKHRGDVHATLGAVVENEAREVLHAITDPRLRQSLERLAPPRGHVLVETLVQPATQRDSLRYTLTKLHAEGGLGKIWIAHDTDLNRDVALKEIKATTSSNPESWRRFLKEAQITGQLEHPNIVPVYELARRKEDDQPFYTMRFVRGQHFGDAIAEFHRRRAGKPVERLELQRQLLEPFIKVCQAVGYAHSRDVIHRDLKPENVVIGGHGEVVVLDWGLAKVVGQPDPDPPQSAEPRISVSSDAQAFKTQGQVGTPLYMAPEQVDARHDLIDSRTDIYGLGAILFQVLTGRSAATGETLGDVYSKIRSGNLPTPRELEPATPRPLEAICVKAMAHERENRYRRAEDLAEDVRRWLVDEPVSIYHDPISVRLMRWGRRHRTLVTTLTALLIATVIGLSVGVVVINHQRALTALQRNRADEQRKIAVANAAVALQNLRLAQNAADGLLGEVADVDLAEIPQMEPVRKRLLEKARAGYEQFLAQQGDDPLVRWGSERSRVSLGDVHALLGEVPRAEASYHQAIDGLERLVKEDPANADFRRVLARALHGIGVVLKDANRIQQAGGPLREAVRLREEIAGGAGASAEDFQSLADSQYQFGALVARRGAGRAEEAAYEAALAVQQKLVQQYGDRPEFRTKLARSRNNLAMLKNAAGNSQDAEKIFSATLELLSSSIEGPQALPGARWQFARASNNLGALLLVHRRDGAGEPLRRAREILMKLTAEFPAVAQYSQELASINFNLGLMAQFAGHPEEAVASLQDSARLLESLRHRFPESPVYRLKLAMTDVALADVQAKTAPAQAETALRKALEEESAVLAEFPDVPEYQSILGRGHYLLARLLQTKNQVTYKPVDAVDQAEQARSLHAKVLEGRPDSDIDQRTLADDQGVLTIALIDVGRLQEATAMAAQLPKTRPADPAAYVQSAALMVKCADGVSTTKGTSREEILARAVGILRDAVRSHVIRSPATLDVKDLRLLHDRDDFKALRDSLAQSPRSG
jgi:eukaryotic-like serine/threonine-protein kinase